MAWVPRPPARASLLLATPCSMNPRVRSRSPRFGAGPCALVLIAVALPVRSQVAPATHEADTKAKDDVSVMSEFKVFDKKPVPFTDANIDIPRGLNDVQPYYVIGPDEIEGS